MKTSKLLKLGIFAVCTVTLVGCGNRGVETGVFSSRSAGGEISENARRQQQNTPVAIERRDRAERGTIWDLFQTNDDPNVTVEVNKYIWRASLDVLNFLPIQAADPFSGVIVTGFGAPPGGGRAYRATILVQDPALDARSLSLSLQTRSGPVSRQTVQAVEDAILTRARQLRVADGRL